MMIPRSGHAPSRYEQFCMCSSIFFDKGLYQQPSNVILLLVCLLCRLPWTILISSVENPVHSSHLANKAHAKSPFFTTVLLAGSRQSQQSGLGLRVHLIRHMATPLCYRVFETRKRRPKFTRLRQQWQVMASQNTDMSTTTMRLPF